MFLKVEVETDVPYLINMDSVMQISVQNDTLTLMRGMNFVPASFMIGYGNHSTAKRAYELLCTRIADGDMIIEVPTLEEVCVEETLHETKNLTEKTISLTYLNDRIKSSRISMTAIAEILGISRQSLYLKTQGKRKFKDSEIEKLCEILHLTT